MATSTQRAISKLNNVIKAIKDEVPKKTEEIANLGLQTAQTTLGLATLDKNMFTQKHRAQLVSQITMNNGEKENSYVISAGANATPEIKYELYYAEYGAGLGALPDAPPSPYIPKGKVIKSGEFQGYWFYKKLYPDEKGFTNTSMAVEYMRGSKLLAREELKKANIELSKKIKKLHKGK